MEPSQRFALVCAALLASICPQPLSAASLQVSPVQLELVAPRAASSVELSNHGTDKIGVQVRVFRWTQVNGADSLKATEDVVASPPMVQLAANGTYLVRIVRLTKDPVQAEEAYRLLIDEIPDRQGPGQPAINFAIRYSIPVFFVATTAKNGTASWSIRQDYGHISVTATNAGDRHLRVAGLNVRGGDGKSVSFGSGLTGYVLGHSTMTWVAPPISDVASVGYPIQLSAVGDQSPINVTIAAPPR